jgi:hypothetical protein
VGFAIGLGLALSFLGSGNEAATAAGAVVIFATLVASAPALQRWRAGLDANRAALAQLGALGEPDHRAARLIAALKQKTPARRPAPVLWVEGIGVGLAVLIVLGVIAVTSQVDSHEDFHRALVSLGNGDCIEGTYLTRGNDQLVVAQPDLDAEPAGETRIAVIPSKEVLAVQVYGDSIEGTPLRRETKCSGSPEPLVQPAEKEKGAEGEAKK